MNLISKTRQFLKENKIDYLLVNSTNEFLAEYNDLEENSRYFLTNFSGSTGEAVISQRNIFLFVDGRYHEQADCEVDKKLVTVIKMKLGESLTSCLVKKLLPNKTLGVVAKKISQSNLETLKNALKDKNIKIKLLDFDPIKEGTVNSKQKAENSGEKLVKTNILSSPLAGEVCLQHERMTARARKQGEGYYNEQAPFDPSPKFQALVPRTEILPSPARGEVESICLQITGLSSDEKFAKISSDLKENEAILITNLEEISYLFNLRDFSKNYSSKIQSGKCIITKNGGEFLETLNLDKFKNIDKIFVDRGSINAYEYAILGKKATPQKTNPIKELKSIKTDEEINHYKQCFERTDKALYETRKFIKENDNISEYDITKNLEQNFYKFGAKSLSFKSIVAKDKNSALAHYSNNSKTEILKDGSLVLIDCGAYYEGGYATDITRVFVKGNPSPLQKEVYTLVLKGVLKAFNKKITPKTTGFDVDKTARKILNELKPKGFEFSHSLGHGIGIGVHESPPSLSPSLFAKTPIKPNMCFTIEPGLYNPRYFGVRLENSCFLEKRETEKDKSEFIIKSFSNMCFEEKLINFEMLTPTEKKQLKKFKVE